MRHLAVINPARLLPALGVMTAIFLVSSQPGDQLILPELLNFDKFWHLLEYGILAVACLFACHQARHHSQTAIALGVVLFATLYGVSDEFHQSFVPLRDASLGDVIADFLGATIAAMLWWRLVRHELTPPKPASN